MQSTKEEYEAMYGEEIWQYELAEDGSTLGEWVKDQTLEQIIYMKIICNQAEAMGISLDEEDWTNIHEQTLDYMAHFQDSELLLYGVGEYVGKFVCESLVGSALDTVQLAGNAVVEVLVGFCRMV